MESHWCLEEFSQAYHQVIQGRLNYIIVVLLEKPAPNKLPPELETYLTTHTYIDARKYADEMEKIHKQIRFAMPKVPLNKVSSNLFHEAFLQIIICLFFFFLDKDTQYFIYEQLLICIHIWDNSEISSHLNKHCRARPCK